MNKNLESSYNYISNFLPLLNEEDFINILDKNLDLKNEMIEYAADTLSREEFMDLWAQEKVNMTFPCYGDSEEIHQEFSKRIHKLKEICG